MLPAQLLEWNRTETGYSRTSTVADCFAAQVERTPDAVALIAGNSTLTYRQLDQHANRLARRLQAFGVAPDTLVGVAMERSQTLVVSILAILKAGGAYVPLDPHFPQDRLALMMEDSLMPVLLTAEKSRARVPVFSSAVKTVDAEDTSMAAESSAPVKSCATPGNLAYVIYTSGSTGKPKGVMIENRNVVNFFTGMDRAIGCVPGVWLAVTSISFDISVLELLWTLTRGFTVVLHDEQGPVTIAEEIARHRVTHLQMTPSLARMLTLDARAYAALAQLKQILLGGEAVPAALVHHLRQVFRGEIHNMYGPTETTIWSTTCPVGEVDKFVSIGKPIANTQIYILDAELKPVPVGEVGELFIGGDGVTRGYWKRPELTAERFIEIPGVGPGRIYRTGDLARFMSDGNIEFLGRADFQVKLRGHRIELGEIEALLESSGGVRQAVVVLREDREGDKRLVAYCNAAETGPAAANALRAELAAKLPDYMIPSAFVFLDAMPLTSNGKTDRKALLQMPPPAVTHAAPEAGDQAASELESVIAQVWQKALGIPTVGMTENFFDLGAHSLTVAEVHGKLQEALGREIALVDLFQYSTVSALAKHLEGAQQPAAAAAALSDRAARRRMARQG